MRDILNIDKEIEILLRCKYMVAMKREYDDLLNRVEFFNPYRNYLSLLEDLRLIAKYNEQDAYSYIKRLKNEKDFKNGEAIYSEILLYKYFVKLNNKVHSIAPNKEKCDLIVNINNSIKYYEVITIQPDRKKICNEHFINFDMFVKTLTNGKNDLSRYLFEKLEKRINDYLLKKNGEARKNIIIELNNNILKDESLYNEDRFAGIELKKETRHYAGFKPWGDGIRWSNFTLLAEAYPKSIKKLAITDMPVDAIKRGIFTRIFCEKILRANQLVQPRPNILVVEFINMGLLIAGHFDNSKWCNIILDQPLAQNIKGIIYYFYGNYEKRRYVPNKKYRGENDLQEMISEWKQKPNELITKLMETK